MRIFKRDAVDDLCTVKVAAAGPYNSVSNFVTMQWGALVHRYGGSWWNPARASVIVLPREGIYLVTANMVFGAGAADFMLIDRTSTGRVLETSISTSGGIVTLAGTIIGSKNQEFEFQAWTNTVQNIGSTGYNLANASFHRLGP